MKNPLRMWMMIPSAALFTAYIFYYEIIKNEIPPLLNFPPSVNNVVQAWGTQNGLHLAGQILLFQFMCLGFLIVYLEWTNHD
tara:strand:+ start:364 stop:609 length:246 start_codon:yes stop_codon:yes gene_type:complete